MGLKGEQKRMLSGEQGLGVLDHEAREAVLLGFWGCYGLSLSDKGLVVCDTPSLALVLRTFCKRTSRSSVA